MKTILTKIPYSSYATQLFECMEKSFVIYEHTLTLSLSIGIAIYPHSGIDTATLLKNANVAMYDAKAKELNSVSIYDDVIAKKLKDDYD